MTVAPLKFFTSSAQIGRTYYLQVGRRYYPQVGRTPKESRPNVDMNDGPALRFLYAFFTRSLPEGTWG